MVTRADKDSTGYISEDDFLEAFDWLMSQGQDERDYMAIFNMLVSRGLLRQGEGARRFTTRGRILCTLKYDSSITTVGEFWICGTDAARIFTNYDKSCLLSSRRFLLRL